MPQMRLHLDAISRSAHSVSLSFKKTGEHIANPRIVIDNKQMVLVSRHFHNPALQFVTDRNLSSSFRHHSVIFVLLTPLKARWRTSCIFWMSFAHLLVKFRRLSMGYIGCGTFSVISQQNI
ncbi:hypothetical protein AGR9A_Cc10018 [Agrobacterium salinitolerans str. Hayward 0363]|nr:hypothetical protein AGR9A_Cc10018 [Agrobacterium salinitolerans str. Hayward 0363]